MKNLDKIFNPKSVAIIGASSKEKTVGLGLVKNILTGKEMRRIFFVNPNQTEILGEKTFAKINDIQEELDLAIIAVPAQFVSQVVSECCEKKVGGIIVISSGFAELGEEGSARQKEILDKVNKAGIPMLGPNCLGIIRTKNKLNASFAPSTPKEGNVAFASQSGALLDVIIDGVERLGVSAAVSFGNEADINLIDILEWLARDEETKVIDLYVEAISNGREFMEVAGKIAKIKPIIVIKAGKFESSGKAVKSHTGSLAGNYETYRAVFKQVGIIEAESIEELIDISKILSWQPACKNSFAIVTNGGGCGVMATDYCKKYGINLAKLSNDTINKISGFKEMSPFWSKSNPIDIIGDASPSMYKVAIESVLAQENIKGLMIIQTPQTMTDPLENAKIIIEAKKLFPEKPIICFFLGGKLSGEAINRLEDNNIPNYSELKRGIAAIKTLVY
jgi:acetyl coenzyme A synthetase (ADP forming)-like protein